MEADLRVALVEATRLGADTPFVAAASEPRRIIREMFGRMKDMGNIESELGNNIPDTSDLDFV